MCYVVNNFSLDFLSLLLLECDRLFMWNGTTGSPNGTFESPTMISEEGHLYQCIFMFLPEQMQRVELVFTQFSVRGTPPE